MRRGGLTGAAARTPPCTDLREARRPRLGAIGQGHEQLGQLGVAMLLEEPRHGVAPSPGARLAYNRRRRGANVRQRERAVVGDPQPIARGWERSKNDIDPRDQERHFPSNIYVAERELISIRGIPELPQ
jgi:hypothetical protein